MRKRRRNDPDKVQMQKGGGMKPQPPVGGKRKQEALRKRHRNDPARCRCEKRRRQDYGAIGAERDIQHDAGRTEEI